MQSEASHWATRFNKCYSEAMRVVQADVIETSDGVSYCCEPFFAEQMTSVDAAAKTPFQVYDAVYTGPASGPAAYCLFSFYASAATVLVSRIEGTGVTFTNPQVLLPSYIRPLYRLIFFRVVRFIHSIVGLATWILADAAWLVS
jgi:hypothetical protein